MTAASSRRRDSHATAVAAAPPASAAMSLDDTPPPQPTAGAAHGATVLCAFIASAPSGDDVRLARQNGFKRDDFTLDKALNECNSIRADHTLVQGLLLRCMDNQPKYKFLHLAVFDANLSAPLSRSLSRRRASRASALIGELSVDNEGAEIGIFEEVFTIQKPVISAPLNEATLYVGRHAGYIVTSFKIYDEHYKQSLEKNWLTWTGAREIYKYSPRTWNLRKISLHRHVNVSTPIRTFAYVLICEYGNILHPSNMLQALDMCERLRVRNCGHIALYQVRYNYGPAPADELPTRLGVQRNRSMSHGQNIISSSPTSPLRSSPSDSIGALPRKTSASAHSSSSKSVGQPISHYRGSVSPRGSTPTTGVSPSGAPSPYWDYAVSPWSSPTVTRKSSAALSQRPLPNTTTSRRQMMMQRGFSQDVDTAHETLRRRAALLRLRDASLGYDTPAALGASTTGALDGTSLLASRGTSAGSMISAGYATTIMGGSSENGDGTPPRPVSPLATSLALPLAAHRYQPQPSIYGSYN